MDRRRVVALVSAGVMAGVGGVASAAPGPEAAVPVCPPPVVVNVAPPVVIVNVAPPIASVAPPVELPPRDDPGDAYRSRGLAGVVVGIALIGASGYFLYEAATPDRGACPSIGDDGWFDCTAAADHASFDRSVKDSLLATGAILGSTAAFMYAAYEYSEAQTVDGRIAGVQVTPYVGADGGGISARGTF